ncbi:MAG: hypothetical protein AABY22_00155 [Nanoarchaeota archaeon]
MSEAKCKYNLKDTTFIIPFMIDHKDRLENLNCILKFLDNNFDTNFILVETGEKSHYFDLLNIGAKHIFNPIKKKLFHRTKLINEGIKLSKTPYVSIYDTDVVFREDSIYEAIQKLKNGATLSYPYNGDFIDIKRLYINDGIIAAMPGESHVIGSFGGACFLNIEDYIKCGMENENFKSHCPDDIERKTRVEKLGYRVERTEGKCYHITHWRGENSGGGRYTEANNAEWNKIKAMNKFELLNYVKSWPWANQK